MDDSIDRDRYLAADIIIWLCAHNHNIQELPPHTNKRRRRHYDITPLYLCCKSLPSVALISVLLFIVLFPDISSSLLISHRTPYRRSSTTHILSSSYVDTTLRCHRRTNHDRFCRLQPICASKSKCNDEEDDTAANDDNDDDPDELINTNGNNLGNRTSSILQGKKQKQQQQTKQNILEMINPFTAGKNLRSTVNSAIDLSRAITKDAGSRLPPDRRAIYYNYYVDDQLGLSSLELKDSAATSSSPSTSSVSSSDEDCRPEVLIVGASGALGRILVKRLILEGKVRVRVLVRNLYSSTLNDLGIGVIYCQGDLNDMESLEYAVTDVDKIVFCAGKSTTKDDDDEEEDWDDLETIEQRSRDAEAIDGKGLQNLLHAYQNVRHADYGTSQAAKRVLFKFRRRPDDFAMFSIDTGSMNGESSNNNQEVSFSQCDWIQNKFGHGVFVGKIGRYGEAVVASARLRSRSDPEQGIDLKSGGFAGLVCRVCSDGGVYEAFVRTEAYERLGVEYVCEFKTASKSSTNGADNTSRNKWSTVRLEFTSFLPRMRQFQSREGDDAQRMRQALGKSDIPPFDGRDIRQIGFRYRGNSYSGSSWSKFYLALDYIKLYRGQLEPEFVYLSDSRIPPVVNDRMINHDLHRLQASPTESLSTSYSIIVEEEQDRSAEETYFKYKGEEMIKQSGLSYTIIRVAGYNTDISTDSSVVRLQKMNKDITPVSRADLAQVIASALLEPNASNLILYMTKAKQRGVKDGDLWEKFARLRNEEPLQSSINSGKYFCMDGLPGAAAAATSANVPTSCPDYSAASSAIMNPIVVFLIVPFT